MGITNAQIAVHLSEFVAVVEKLIENDNLHHKESRIRQEDIILCAALAKAEREGNTSFRKAVGKWFFVAVLVPIGATVVQLILK